MENNDDILLMMFFDEQRQDIDDNGFSENVMRQLPQQSAQPYIIWQIVCSVAGGIVFILAGGIGMLRTAFLNSCVNMVSYILSIDLSAVSPLMLLAAMFGICSVTVCVTAVFVYMGPKPPRIPSGGGIIPPLSPPR